MEARMKNPAMILPGTYDAVQGLIKATRNGVVPAATMELVHLRTSQINGCAACVDAGMRSAKKAGESDERLWSIATWREAPYYTDAERAALALAEAMTRLPDRHRADAVPEDVWEEANRHFDEQGLAALLVWIATANFFNRVNTAIKEPAGISW